MSKEVVLARYSFILQEDGQVCGQIDNVDPAEFKAASEGWDGSATMAKAIEYLVREFAILDQEFEKYLMSL